MTHSEVALGMCKVLDLRYEDLYVSLKHSSPLQSEKMSVDWWEEVMRVYVVECNLAVVMMTEVVASCSDCKCADDDAGARRVRSAKEDRQAYT